MVWLVIGVLMKDKVELSLILVNLDISVIGVLMKTGTSFTGETVTAKTSVTVSPLEVAVTVIVAVPVWSA